MFTVLRDHHAALHPLLQVRAESERFSAEAFRPSAIHGRDSWAELLDKGNETVAAGDGTWALQELTHDDAQQAKGE